MAAEEGQEIEVMVPVRRWRTRFLERVARADIVSSRDEFVTQVFPTSSLPQTPAARLQVVGEMQDRGFLPPEAAQSLLNFPDLESETALIAAPIEHIDWVISRMLDHGESMRPEPWENMPLARQRASQALMRAQMEGVDEERWQLVAVYVEACNAALEAEKQAPSRRRNRPGRCAGGHADAGGDVIHKLGAHRIMCGDAGNPDDVAELFDGRKPDLVFTSPPYAQQRDYGARIACWDTLMKRVFGALPWHDRTQVLVNLGLVHRKGEVWEYWREWVEWMRAQGWRFFGQYIWDKKESVPGDHNGRLAPSHEMILHFNRQARYPCKTVPCKRAGETYSRATVQRSNRQGSCATQPRKIDDSVLRISPEKGTARRLGHPAVFPVALPLAIHAAYTDPGQLIYDPFAGSGTSILAAEQGGRVCYGMEIHPPYVDIALDRWRRLPAQLPLAQPLPIETEHARDTAATSAAG